MRDKHKQFADEYLIDLNATRAYKAVYTSVKSDEAARVNASRLLTNANIKAYVDEKKKERSEETGITAKMVVEELAQIGFADSAVACGLEIRANDKLKALELLGKHLGMFTEKQIVAQTSLEEYLNKFGDDYEY